MKKALLFSFLLFLIPHKAFAVESNVHVSVSNSGSDSNSSVIVNSNSQGSSTTCINGNCTTTSGESHSKVCVNGKCTESSGDLDISDDNGKTQVHINNSSSAVTATVTPIKNESITPTQAEDKKTVFEPDDKGKNEKKQKKESIIEKLNEIIKGIFHFWNN